MKTLGQIAYEAAYPEMAKHCDWANSKDPTWIRWQAAAQAVRREVLEECAKVCDEGAKRNFPWASENSDTYHAQADWAEMLAKAIRLLKEKGDNP